MERVFYNLAEDLYMEELIEKDFPDLAYSSMSKKEIIKKAFGLIDFSSISIEELAHTLSSHPEKIRDIYTH